MAIRATSPEPIPSAASRINLPSSAARLPLSVAKLPSNEVRLPLRAKPETPLESGQNNYIMYLCIIRENCVILQVNINLKEKYYGESGKSCFV